MAHLFTDAVQAFAASSATYTLSTSVAAGSLIRVTIRQNYGANPPRVIASVADNVNSGNYAVAAENTASVNIKIHDYYIVANATGTPTITITMTGGSADFAVAASVYDSTHTVLDATNSATGTGTAINPGSATPSASALYWHACGIGPQYDTVTLPGAFTARTTYQGINGSVPFSLATGDIIGGTGAQNPTTTLSASREWAASIATFIVAGDAPAPSSLAAPSAVQLLRRSRRNGGTNWLLNIKEWW